MTALFLADLHPIHRICAGVKTVRVVLSLLKPPNTHSSRDDAVMRYHNLLLKVEFRVLGQKNLRPMAGPTSDHGRRKQFHLPVEYPANASGHIGFHLGEIGYLGSERRLT